MSTENLYKLYLYKLYLYKVISKEGGGVLGPSGLSLSLLMDAIVSLNRAENTVGSRHVVSSSCCELGQVTLPL